MRSTGKYIVQNNRIIPASQWRDPESAGHTAFYEVIRFEAGIGLFAEVHVHRLAESVRIAGFAFRLDEEAALMQIRQLIETNNRKRGNLRLVLSFPPGNDPLVTAFLVPFSYPGKKMRMEGVAVSLLHAERHHPNMKRKIDILHKKVNEILNQTGHYEVLLVDRHRFITEGSRSNVFFIHRSAVYTAPADQVLKGITRQKVLDICQSLRYKVIERSVSIDELDAMDAVFLTGTSPKVLPVCRLGNRDYPPNHPVTKKIARAYNRMIREYIQIRK